MAMILDMLRTRAGMKQDVFANTREAFGDLKEALQEVADDLGRPAIGQRRAVHRGILRQGRGRM
jgi:hypothetical protein